ncbi:MAG: fumarylacetoacetate hydrolase family protein [Anaerolineae bacterium]|nr:fumarylacetoacetate hydrolase family protein [Anaerolineae bacterium]
MKLARFEWQGRAQWGVVQGEALHVLQGELWGEMVPGQRLCSLAEARLLAPIEPQCKALGLGLTYKDMYRNYELREGKAHRDGPAVFMKPSNTIIAHGEPIVYHRVCKRVIYEAEVGLVIGRKASRLSAEGAMDYVAGYTCVNDLTCTDFSTVERPIVSTRFKICDTFCPMGPFVETEMDPDNITVICRVNGREVEYSRTGRDMIWSMGELLAWVTSFMTLMPGDVISTGAAGTGRVEVGDLVEVDIPGIGVLRNPVAAP